MSTLYIYCQKESENTTNVSALGNSRVDLGEYTTYCQKELDDTNTISSLGNSRVGLGEYTTYCQEESENTVAIPLLAKEGLCPVSTLYNARKSSFR